MKAALNFVSDHWQAVVIGVLLVVVLLLNQRLAVKTAEHEAYVARVTATAAQAEANKERVEHAQDNNLQTIEDKHDEKHVEAVRAGAVDVVRRRVRQPAAGSGSLPGIAARFGQNDEAREECSAAYAIVADAAEDADTLTMWQEWARLNNIPVRP